MTSVLTLAATRHVVSALAVLALGAPSGCTRAQPGATTRADDRSVSQDRIVVTITCDLAQVDADYRVSVDLSLASGEYVRLRAPVQVQTDLGAVVTALRVALDQHGVFTPGPFATSDATREIVLPVGCRVIAADVARVHGTEASTCFTVSGVNG